MTALLGFTLVNVNIRTYASNGNKLSEVPGTGDGRNPGNGVPRNILSAPLACF